MGWENIPSEPVILAANHSSYLDPFLLTVLYPYQIRFIAKKELFKNPFTYPFVKGYSSIPLDRGKPSSQSLKEAISSLKRGINVGIFPEGRRTYKRLPPKPGLGFLVLKTGRKVLPVSVIGTRDAVKKLLTLRRPEVKVIFHPPVNLTPSVPLSDEKEAYRDIGNKVLDIIYSPMPGDTNQKEEISH